MHLLAAGKEEAANATEVPAVGVVQTTAAISDNIPPAAATTIAAVRDVTTAAEQEAEVASTAAAEVEQIVVDLTTAKKVDAVATTESDVMVPDDVTTESIQLPEESGKNFQLLFFQATFVLEFYFFGSLIVF